MGPNSSLLGTQHKGLDWGGACWVTGPGDIAWRHDGRTFAVSLLVSLPLSCQFTILSNKGENAQKRIFKKGIPCGHSLCGDMSLWRRQSTFSLLSSLLGLWTFKYFLIKICCRLTVLTPISFLWDRFLQKIAARLASGYFLQKAFATIT